MNHNKGAEGQKGANTGQLPSRGRGAIPYIGNAPNAAPNTPPEGQVRILLSEAASKHLTETGEHAFVAASRVMRGAEEPETAGRWALYLIPCDIPDADAAIRVARGLSKESKPRKPKL
jgi:hypothetical protein